MLSIARACGPAALDRRRRRAASAARGAFTGCIAASTRSATVGVSLRGRFRAAVLACRRRHRARLLRGRRGLGVHPVEGTPRRGDRHARRHAADRRACGCTARGRSRGATCEYRDGSAGHVAGAHAARPRHGPARAGASPGGSASAGDCSSSRSQSWLEITERCNGHRGAAKLRAVVADGPAPTRSPLEDDAARPPRRRRASTRPEINASLRLGGQDDHPRLPVARPAARDRGRQRHLARPQAHPRERRRQAGDPRSARASGCCASPTSRSERHPEQTLARIRAALAATR